ncbi:MAG: S9 family peptidase [Bacteroidales bacterium]|nr:S9 family peptidase [Bacteroidales bacterium]MEA4840919.1 S9 family peptidase [Bacteroidales bacterium]
MKRISLLLILSLNFFLLPAAKQEISLDSIISGTFRSASIPEIKSMQDGRYYTCIDENGQQIIQYSYLTGKQEAVILDIHNLKGVAPKKIVGYAFSPTEKRMIVWGEKDPIYRRSYTTEYYVYDVKRNFMEVLSENGAQRDAKFSPDGRSIAFSRGNNLFIKRLDYGTEIPVTTDGSENAIINGVPDWVYEEEFEETCAFDWSPDSKFLAYVKFNEKEVPDYSFPLFGAIRSKQNQNTYYPGYYAYKYPSAGNVNSSVSVYAFNLQTRSAKKMNVPVSEEDYIPRIRFTRNNSQLAIMTLNRAQNVFKMYFANPKSAQCKLALTDESEKYVEPMYDAIQFSTKHFTYVSEKDGYRHLYLYGANGGQQKQLTSGKWDLTKYLGCDTINNVYYYQSTEEGPTQRSIYRIDLKGKKFKISAKSGVNEGSFNVDYSYYVQTWSDIKTPQEYSICNAFGEMVRPLENNKGLRSLLSKSKYTDKTFISVPAADGEMLNGWMLEPSDFDKNKKYPVLQIQYSGPNSQSALDKFDFGWEYYLAEKGYIVVCVDGRGTGGRGEAFRKSTWCNLGIFETEDQVATANYLKKQSYVDGSRIGIWGWSYGGYISLMSMTDASGVFKAGIAIGPVCDWRYYNTIYTERYMRTPKENKPGYDAGSPLLRAANLKGRLLLVHGMIDDNVRVNQSMDMTEALIQAGVQFDMQLYPTSNHSMIGKTYQLHLYNRLVDFVLRNL